MMRSFKRILALANRTVRMSVKNRLRRQFLKRLYTFA
jgi:hypothetical protein